MKKDRITVIKTDPEVEEMEFLNRRTQENLDKQALEEKQAKQKAAQIQAKKHRLQQLLRKRTAQMNHLLNRVALSLTILFGVCLSFIFGLVEPLFLWFSFFCCSCIVAFSFGQLWEKTKS